MSARSLRSQPAPVAAPPENPTASLAALFTLSTNDLVITREHFVALVAVQGRAEFEWIVDGIEAELTERGQQ